MKTFTVKQAEEQLDEILELVESGGLVVVERDVVPIAEFTPVKANPAKGERKPGLWKDIFPLPDDFIEEFDSLHQEEIEKMFYGNDLPPLELPPHADAAE